MFRIVDGYMIKIHLVENGYFRYNNNNNNNDSVALVREVTIPTGRPLLVGEVSANFCGKGV
jgi:hypothetical protein